MNLSKINPKIVEIIDDSPWEVGICEILLCLFMVDIGESIIRPDIFINLINTGLIRKNYDNCEYELVYSLYSQEEDKSVITDEWIEEYRNKFTSYGKSIKVGIKGDKAICKKKIEKWLKNNKSAKSSLDEILLITEFYVNGMLAAGKGKFIMQADNFIYKDSQSMLSNMLEEYRNTSKESDIFDNQMI